MFRTSIMLGVVALAIGCAPSGRELAVDVRTDFAPGIEVNAIRIVLDDGDYVVRDVSLEDDFSTGERVAEFSGLPLGRHALRVELRRGGRTFLSQDVAVRLDGDLILLVVLARTCEDVVCPTAGDPDSATTCFGGACVDPACLDVARETDAGAPMCGPMECETSSDCDERGGCVEPSCERGACLWLPARDRCGADEYCDPSVGECTPLPGVPRDAGMPDAGPLDPPLGLMFAASGTTSVAATWTAPSGAASYEIQLSTAADCSTVVQTGTPTTESQRFSDLAPGQPYYARVRALRMDGTTSEWSEIATATTPIDTPGAPSVSVTIPGASRTQAAGRWVHDPGAGMYYYAQGTASVSCASGTSPQYRFWAQYTSPATLYGPTAWSAANDAYMIRPNAPWGVRFIAEARCVTPYAMSAASPQGSGCRLRTGGGC